MTEEMYTRRQTFGGLQDKVTAKCKALFTRNVKHQDWVHCTLREFKM